MTALAARLNFEIRRLFCHRCASLSAAPMPPHPVNFSLNCGSLVAYRRHHVALALCPQQLRQSQPPPGNLGCALKENRRIISPRASTSFGKATWAASLNRIHSWLLMIDVTNTIAPSMSSAILHPPTTAEPCELLADAVHL